MFSNDDWEKVKQIIKIETGMTHISYLTWIDPLSIKYVRDHKVELAVPNYAPDNSFAIQYINSHYADYIKHAVSNYLGEDVEIELS